MALSETRSGEAGSYELLEHEFVLSPRDRVTVYCEAGDTLVAGGCIGRAEDIVSTQIRELYDGPHPQSTHRAPIMFESQEVTEQGKTGWQCRATLVRADQELRVTATAKCKKTGVKAQRSKTNGRNAQSKS